MCTYSYSYKDAWVYFFALEIIDINLIFIFCLVYKKMNSKLILNNKFKTVYIHKHIYIYPYNILGPSLKYLL